MKEERTLGMIALVIVLVSLLSLAQGYANGPNPIITGSTKEAIRSVSNPSGNCINLGLTNYHGSVVISHKHLYVYLYNANPNSAYNVLVGYMSSKNACDGTWQSLGSINTNNAGSGQLIQSFSLSGHQYVFELRDGQGSAVYATPFISL